MQKTIQIKHLPTYFRSDTLKENEIRTGLFLLYREEIIQVSLSNISTILNNLREYNPVPLDKDILKALGYTRNADMQKFYNDRFDYYFIFSGKIGMIQKYNVGSVGVPVRYVHELQNIYYFLTGEELTMKLTSDDIADAL